MASEPVRAARAEITQRSLLTGFFVFRGRSDGQDGSGRSTARAEVQRTAECPGATDGGDWGGRARRECLVSSVRELQEGMDVGHGAQDQLDGGRRRDEGKTWTESGSGGRDARGSRIRRHFK